MKKYTKKLRHAWYCAAVRSEAFQQYQDDMLTPEEYRDIYVAHQCPMCNRDKSCYRCGAWKECGEYGRVSGQDWTVAYCLERSRGWKP